MEAIAGPSNAEPRHVEAKSRGRSDELSEVTVEYPESEGSELANTSSYLATKRDFFNVLDTITRRAKEEMNRITEESVSRKRKWEELDEDDRQIAALEIEEGRLTETLTETQRLLNETKTKKAEITKRMAAEMETMTRDLAKTDSILGAATGQTDGLKTFATQTRECPVCFEIKQEAGFLWNSVCSHSVCSVCTRRNREHGNSGCVLCRAKLTNTFFGIISVPSGGYRFSRLNIKCAPQPEAIYLDLEFANNNNNNNIVGSDDEGWFANRRLVNGNDGNHGNYIIDSDDDWPSRNRRSSAHRSGYRRRL